MSELHETFRPDEVTRIGCRCKSCGTEIIIEVENENSRAGNECPGCGASLFPLGRLVSDYRAFFRTAAESKIDVRFHVKAEEAE